MRSVLLLALIAAAGCRPPAPTRLQLVPTAAANHAPPAWLVDASNAAATFWNTHDEHVEVDTDVRADVATLLVLVDDQPVTGIDDGQHVDAFAAFDGAAGSGEGTILLDASNASNDDNTTSCVIAHEIGHSLDMAHVHTLAEQASLPASAAASLMDPRITVLDDNGVISCPWSDLDQRELDAAR